MKKCILAIVFLNISFLSYGQSLPPNAKEGWTIKIRQEGIDDCVMNAVKMNERNHDLTVKFCECSSDKIIQMMTYKESQDLFASTHDKQAEVINPVVESCLAEVQKQETAEQLLNSKLAERDTMVNFENSLMINVPAGLKWNILDRNGIKSFAINQQLQFGNIILMVVKFDNTTFKEAHSQMVNFYSNNPEPKYNLSNKSDIDCPTSDCANYELEMLITGISAKGRMYFFGDKGTYFNAYFVTTGEPTMEIVNQLKAIIQTSEPTLQMLITFCDEIMRGQC